MLGLMLGVMLAFGVETACDTPELGLATRIEAPKILATRSIPAEARPGEPMQREFLIVDQNGRAQMLQPELAICSVPRRLGERGYISQACFYGAGMLPQSIDGALWDQGCAIYGPNPPPVDDSEQSLRPADPDKSGGYYVPERVVAEVNGSRITSFSLLRTQCDLVGATRDVFDAFRTTYSPNQHPDLETAKVWVNQNAGWTQPSVSAPGLNVEIQVPPEQSESYPIYNQIYNRLDPGQEQLTMRVYSNRGELLPSAQSLGLAALQQGQRFRFELQNALAPQPGAAPLIVWLVLEDERGGRSWRAIRFEDG